jgi:predicted membrane protein (TIGR00267 family)
VMPFLASQMGLLPIDTAYYSSALMVSIVLFILGVIVGKIGKSSVIKSGMRMVLAGVIVGLIVIALESLQFV